MLYINTNDKTQTYTAFQALYTDPQNGMIAPIRLPLFTENELKQIFALQFNEVIAYILNKFFSQDITSEALDRTLDFSAPFLEALDRKTLLVRFGDELDAIEQRIFATLVNNDRLPSVWTRCAIRIGVFFAVFAELERCAIHCADISVVSNDVVAFVPVLYGKIMGLPVNQIITATSFEDPIWNYLHKCSDGSGAVFDYFRFGLAAIADQEKFLSEFSSYVVSDERAKEAITNIQSTYRKNIDVQAALSYGAIQDHRAITGENRTTIILSN